jgi:hypothetical protein
MNDLKSQITKVVTTLVVVIIALVVWFALTANKNTNEITPVISAPITESENTDTNENEFMNITVHLQDKEVALKSDCGVTYPKIVKVPKTKGVADASLKYLFTNELSQYGKYESILIKENIAQVVISNENDPMGLKISSLSSCESGHLLSVLNDTLTQYENIKSVELYSPFGKIEF